MESATQPILCCLGDCVAGLPTQFLMERALGPAGVDWRVLTVEVEPERFDDALTGMLAMRFQAARFFPLLDSVAARSPQIQSPMAEFVGSVSSVILDGDHYQGWHHAGPVVMAQINQLSAKSNSPENSIAIWLFGNTPFVRSVVAALEYSNLSGCLWLGDYTKALPIPIADTQLRNLTTAEEAIAAWSALAEAIPIGSLALISDEVSDIQISPNALESIPGDLHFYIRKPVSKQLVSELGWPSHARVCAGADLQVLFEAYDFQRWTGRAVDPAQLRDALDEFSDF
ncbi:MAG: hypothetical protein KDB03_03690 [Planctomycetales bacterium]|nr:hypothetical protein [Planctomycetales bacterium]